MKYIPGAKFTNNTFKNTKLFKKGVLYKLSNITRNEDSFTYTFLVKGEKKDITFKSIAEADEWLDIIKV